MLEAEVREEEGSMQISSWRRHMEVFPVVARSWSVLVEAVSIQVCWKRQCSA